MNPRLIMIMKTQVEVKLIKEKKKRTNHQFPPIHCTKNQRQNY